MKAQDYFPLSAIVRVSGFDPYETKGDSRPFSYTENGKTFLSNSGFFILPKDQTDPDHLFVVTTALLFGPFLHKMEPPYLLNGTEISISCKRSEIDDSIIDLPASLVSIELIYGLLDLFKSIFQNQPEKWQLNWSVKDKQRLQKMHANLINRVAILKVSKRSLLLPALTLTQPAEFEKTKPLFILGSPFGFISPSLFLNSFTSGIISNVISLSKYNTKLILTDARIFPGMEGSLSVLKNGGVVGMALPPIAHTHNVEFNFIVSFDAIIEAFESFLQKSNQMFKLNFVNNNNNINSSKSQKVNHNNLQNDKSFQNDNSLQNDNSFQSLQNDNSFQNDKGLQNDNSLQNDQTNVREPDFKKLILKSQNAELHSFQNNTFKQHVELSYQRLNSKPEIVDNFESSAPLSPENLQETNSITQTIERAIVLITAGPQWCTGVIVDPEGFVITTKHSTRAMRSYPIRAQLFDFSVLSCELIFEAENIDFALLKLTDSRKQLTFSSFSLSNVACSTLEPLDSVYAVGFPVFLPSKIRPTWTSGKISKLVRESTARTALRVGDDVLPPQRQKETPHDMVCIMTTALIQNGNSGGALVDQNGHLVGIVRSNVQINAGPSICYAPKLNFTVPASNFSEPLLEFFKTKDHRALKKIDEKTDSEIRSFLWDMAQQELIPEKEMIPPHSELAKFLKSHSLLEFDDPKSKL